ncbi:Asp23/Gls24 family envelope stress response protein [Jatrophihabitans endophyticus]|uniref:Asp23/Gls24 family envelope stress response protein n=1 Tax=Jatrophihabitans endophyticus TaxID=1206085 RepID=UPI0026EE36A0|nr:Asp23/Gls24 family envelope stress response protein [Jatrophihabitans endophyticus]
MPVSEAAERGALHVADKVVHKIARQAAREVARTVELPPRLVDRLPGRRARSSRVDTVIGDGSVAVQVTIAVEYPSPVVEVTREVRSHVTEVVTRTCDLRVTSVDIDVVHLRRAPAARSGTPVRRR